MKNILYCSLFSLFYHDINFKDEFTLINTEELYCKTIGPQKHELQDIADVLEKIVIEYILGHKNDEISLTLTGGMDSRVILACLLKNKIKPNCLTFGNPRAKDVYFARKLAQGFGLNFHNAIEGKPTKGWYYNWVLETIKRDNGNSHLHRAHRTAAIAEHVERYSPKVLFTGHMGGEGLRGLTYNNYFASPFFESVNEGYDNPSDKLKEVLEDHFLKTEEIDFNDLLDRVSELSWMQHDRETNKLFFLYNLVAKIHHAQDIRLYSTYVPKVVPVYLQKKYLDVLFSSAFHFLAKRKGLSGRLENPYVHCKLLEILYPKLLDYPLANGYKPADYLKGLWYYVPVRLYRKFRQKRQFVPTFSYGQWYVDFVKELSGNIDSDIWEIFDRKKYMKALERQNHKADEGYWHKFSNPIFFDLVQRQQKRVLGI